MRLFMSEREWRFYVQGMLGFADNVIAYSDGLTLEAFESTGLNYDATVCNLELIGEAATHIPAEIREQYKTVPWRQIIATRNRLIHGYLGIDNDILWDIIQGDIPSIIKELQQISIKK